MGERGVRFGRGLVEHHRGRGARCGSRPHFGRPEHTVVPQQAVGVGQAAVRQRVLGIFDDRAVKKIRGLVQALFGPLVQVIAALQIQIPRREIFRATPERTGTAGLG
jgi:hypothetical protein